ncbi:MAG: hypothetical protein WBW62_03660 [Solirubrobacterales bacterium]
MLTTVVLTSMILLMPVAADAKGGIDPEFAKNGIQSQNFGSIGTGRDRSNLIDSTGTPTGETYLLSSGGYRAQGLEIAKFLADGRIDRSYGRDGVSYVNFKEGGSVSGGAIAADSKGRLILAGTTKVKCGKKACRHIALMRLDRRGRFDPSYRTGEMFKGPLGIGNEMAVLPNGRILVAGFNDGNFNLSRFKADGSIDRKFGRRGVGIAEAESRGPSSTSVTGITFDSRGRILLAASSARGRGYFARFKTNGRADRTFGTSGVFQTAKAEGSRGIEVLPGGRIVTADSDDFWNNNCANLFALLPDGGIDQEFNDSAAAAVADTCDESVSHSVSALDLDIDGNLTVIGRYGKGQIMAQKFNVDASRVVSYGASGIALFPGGSGQISDGFVDHQGRVVATGRTSDGAGQVGRFTVDGTADPAFGSGGIATYTLSAPSGDTARQVFRAGNRVLVAGSTNARTENGNGNRFSFTRLLPNGKPDRKFGDKGQVITGIRSERRAMLGYSSGKIFVGGRIELGDDDDYHAYMAISRYRSNGSIDSSYGNGGLTAEATLDGMFPEYLMAQPDGGVVTVDKTRSGAKMARINPAGGIDLNFGSGGSTNIRIPHDSGASLSVESVATDRKGLPILVFSRGSCRPNLCGTNELVVLKFNSRGRPATGFGGRGQMVSKARTVDAMSVVPDGRVIITGMRCVGGSAEKCAKRRFVLVLKKNGRPDRSFGRRGLSVSPVRDVKVSAVTATRSAVILAGERAGRPALLSFGKNGKPSRGWGRGGLVSVSAGLGGALNSISTMPNGRLVSAGALRTSDEADNFLTVGLTAP